MYRTNVMTYYVLYLAGYSEKTKKEGNFSQQKSLDEKMQYLVFSRIALLSRGIVHLVPQYNACGRYLDAKI